MPHLSTSLPAPFERVLLLEVPERYHQVYRNQYVTNADLGLPSFYRLLDEGQEPPGLIIQALQPRSVFDSNRVWGERYEPFTRWGVTEEINEIDGDDSVVKSRGMFSKDPDHYLPTSKLLDGDCRRNVADKFMSRYYHSLLKAGCAGIYSQLQGSNIFSRAEFDEIFEALLNGPEQWRHALAGQHFKTEDVYLSYLGAHSQPPSSMATSSFTRVHKFLPNGEPTPYPLISVCNGSGKFLPDNQMLVIKEVVKSNLRQHGVRFIEMLQDSEFGESHCYLNGNPSDILDNKEFWDLLVQDGYPYKGTVTEEHIEPPFKLLLRACSAVGVKLHYNSLLLEVTRSVLYREEAVQTGDLGKATLSQGESQIELARMIQGALSAAQDMLKCLNRGES
jgi:hypothetical protein